MNALFCALDKKEFHRVSSCMYTRFMDIVSTLEALGKIFSNSEKVKKIIRSLPMEWRPKRTIIEEAKDLNTLPINNLIGKKEEKHCTQSFKVTEHFSRKLVSGKDSVTTRTKRRRMSQSLIMSVRSLDTYVRIVLSSTSSRIRQW